MTPRRDLVAAALAGTLAVAGLAAGCGGDEGDGGRDRAQPPAPVAGPEGFPAARGKTIAQMRRQYGQGGLVLSPSVSELEPGENRFGFGLFDPGRAQIADTPVAVYVAPVDGGPARGPFPARYESLETKPRFRSEGVAADRDSAKSVYVADVRFGEPGRYELLGLARLDDRLVAATPAGPPVTVRRDSRVPEVGDRAPRTETPTKTDVGGRVEEIDTRVPPSTMHDSNLAEVIGKKPVALLFATPALCQSRVCGPVVDIAEQVKAGRGDEVEFIHMEIYNDNQVEKGFRPQVLRWRLPTEPWLFTIDRKGRIAARMEGAFSVRELDQAIDRATRR